MSTRVEQLERAIDNLVCNICDDDDFWTDYTQLPISIKNLIISKSINLLYKNEEFKYILTKGTDQELHDRLESFLRDLAPPMLTDSLLKMFNRYWVETDELQKSELRDRVRKGVRSLLMRCYLLVNK